MVGQLHTLVVELQAAERRLQALRDTAPADAWHRRPEADRWSPAECVAHLNLTSEAVLPLLRDGLRQAGDARRSARTAYRRGAVGWCLWNILAPISGVKMRTVAAFVPPRMPAISSAIADFERLQAEIIACVRAADGLPIDRVTIVSPFDRRVKYNLYAALTLTPRHQHRHLHQAEHAARAIAPRVSVPCLIAPATLSLAG